MVTKLQRWMARTRRNWRRKDNPLNFEGFRFPRAPRGVRAVIADGKYALDATVLFNREQYLDDVVERLGSRPHPAAIPFLYEAALSDSRSSGFRQRVGDKLAATPHRLAGRALALLAMRDPAYVNDYRTALKRTRFGKQAAETLIHLFHHTNLNSCKFLLPVAHALGNEGFRFFDHLLFGRERGVTTRDIVDAHKFVGDAKDAQLLGHVFEHLARSKTDASLHLSWHREIEDYLRGVDVHAHPLVERYAQFVTLARTTHRGDTLVIHALDRRPLSLVWLRAHPSLTARGLPFLLQLHSAFQQLADQSVNEDQAVTILSNLATLKGSKILQNPDALQSYLREINALKANAKPAA